MGFFWNDAWAQHAQSLLTNGPLLTELAAHPVLTGADPITKGSMVGMPFKVTIDRPWHVTEDFGETSQEVALYVADEVDAVFFSAFEKKDAAGGDETLLSDNEKIAAKLRVRDAQVVQLLGSEATVLLEVEAIDNPIPALAAWAVIAAAISAAVVATQVDWDFAVVGVEMLGEGLVLLAEGAADIATGVADNAASLATAAQLAAVAGVLIAITR